MKKAAPQTLVHIEHLSRSLPAQEVQPGNYVYLLDEEGQLLEDDLYLVAKISDNFFTVKAYALEEETEDLASDSQRLFVSVQTGRARPVRTLDWVYVVPNVQLSIIPHPKG